MSFLKKFTKKGDKTDSGPSQSETQSQQGDYNRKESMKSVPKESTKDVTGKKEKKKDGKGEDNAEENIQENIEPPVNPLDTLVQMKKGDYNVHILIEDVKNLVPVKDNTPPVPRVKVTVFDKVQRTAKMKQPCFDYSFNEHFYFDKTNMTVEMLDSEKIIIEVYDNKHTDRKDYFGIYEIDFAYVYGKKEHAMKNTWIGLSNTESDDMTKIRGYLKLSVSVLNEDDNRVELEPKDNGDESCIMPNEIKMKYKQISFYFIRGEKFPDMDEIFSQKKGDDKQCDGYIIMKYMGITRKTKIVKMKKEVCLWHQVIDMPATDPCVSQKICMTVKDYDLGREDDIVGSYEFFIQDIYDGKYSKFDYIDIYGSPLNKHTKIAEQMGYNAEIGSRWNGRVFMKCDVREVDSPTSSVRDISDNKIIAEAREVTNKEQYIWNFYIRVMSALYLPHKDREYKIKISIQENEIKTGKKKAINHSIDFNETLKMQFKSLHSDKAKLPDMFIYLEDQKHIGDTENVSFQRIKAQEFYMCQDVLYIKLLPDPVINSVKTMKDAGLLKCKICLFNSKTDQPPDMKEFESTGQFQLASLSSGKFLGGGDMQFYKICAVVYMSKGLVAAESNGTSDPFVVLKLGEKEKSTNYKQNTMNGVWNEILEFDEIYMDIKDQRTWPVFLLNVFDKNKFLSNVPLGYNYLWLSNSHFSINSFDLIKPKWHDLFLPKSNIKQGQILISFYIFDRSIKEEGKALHDKINFLPKTELYNFEINVLGLRELKPLGLISVKKPFIKFDLNSLNVTGKPEDDHTPIKTIPVSGGINPTINTVIQFETKLPIQEEFLPELQCEVYDNILSGMANSLLGVFSINLKKIIKTTKIQVQEDINEAQGSLGLSIFGKGLFKSFNFGLNNLKLGNNILGIGTNNNIINTNNNIINTNNNSINTNNNIINTNIIDTSSNNNITTSSEGMKEKNADNNNEENNINNDKNNSDADKGEKETISSVSGELKSKDSSTFDENEHFLEEDDNKLVDEKTNGQVNLNELKGQNNILYTIMPRFEKFSLTHSKFVERSDLLREQNLHDPVYFIIYPTLMNFHVPGYAADEKDAADGEKKVQKELLVEDPSRIPPDELYFQIGYLLKYDESTNDNVMTKHYRRIYKCPLENVDVENFNMSTPFNVRKIRRGKYVDKRSETELFDAMGSVQSKIIHKFNKENSVNEIDVSKGLNYKSFSSFESEEKRRKEKKEKKGKMKEDKKNKMMFSEIKGEKSFGKFKGIVRVTEHSLLKKYEQQIEESKEKAKIAKTSLNLKNYNKYSTLREKLLNKKEVIIRVYILEMNELARRDLLSDSDPYIKLYLNDKLVVNEKKNHQDDQKNCKWYKHYDITGEMPGSSNLKIEVMDYDDLLSDDLIGYTIIDLEDRYFNSDWQAIPEKPIEVRPLLNLDYTGAQGYIYLWLEIFESSLKSLKEPWQISPEPATEFEVRFVVWETEDMEMMDIEGTSDIYIIGFLDQKDSQKTDIHFRCQDGNASFNWRMLLPLTLPAQKPLLSIQVYDKDIFASDDYISGATLNLKDLMTLPKFLGLPVKFNKQYYEGLTLEQQKVYGDIEFLSEADDEDGIKFWVQCYKGKKEATGEGELGGRVLCTLEILPKALADKNKLGKGRSNPNKDPYCPPPTGRMECSLNPCKMINQCVGPKFRKKCYCYIIMCLVIVYLIFALPNMIGKIISP